LSIINNKGGVGKTTTAIHLACGMARRDRRVLLVDLDSQGSASLSLGISRSDLEPSMASVLFEDLEAQEAIRTGVKPNLDVLTGSLELANTDTRLSEAQEREKRIHQALAAIRSIYDLIVVDCAPSTSLLTVNALVASDAFIIPTSPSYLSIEGIISLGRVVARIRQGIGQAAPTLGILLTMVDPDANVRREANKQLRAHYGGKVFDTEIRRHRSLEEAPARGKSVFEYAPDAPAAADYRSFVDEVAARLERYGSVYDSMGTCVS
jgi:chromosome partitioning protein